MELDKENNTIKLQTAAEYVVVASGFKAGLRYYELKAQHEPLPDLHDNRVLSVDALKDLNHAYDEMPTALTEGVLPYAMPVDHAKVALRGVQRNRRQPESRKARLAHRSIGIQLAKLLRMKYEM